MACVHVARRRLAPLFALSRDLSAAPTNLDAINPLTETEEDMTEAVRKAVRQIGKEPATQRLTLEEKQALAEIEYSYKRQGVKTSGNEIIRIATNYLVRDYQKNGAKSILAKVLQKLNS